MERRIDRRFPYPKGGKLRLAQGAQDGRRPTDGYTVFSCNTHIRLRCGRKMLLLLVRYSQLPSLTGGLTCWRQKRSKAWFAPSGESPEMMRDQDRGAPSGACSIDCPTSTARHPARKATPTVWIAVGTRSDRVLQQLTVAAARDPVHNPIKHGLE